MHSHPSEPLILKLTPDFPWYKVGVDLFQYVVKSYTARVYTVSKFAEVEVLNDTSLTTVVEKLGAKFASYGIPVYTNNGAHFSGREFGLFASKYDFRRITLGLEFFLSKWISRKWILKKEKKKQAKCFGWVYSVTDQLR